MTILEAVNGLIAFRQRFVVQDHRVFDRWVGVINDHVARLELIGGRKRDRIVRGIDRLRGREGLDVGLVEYALGTGPRRSEGDRVFGHRIDQLNGVALLNWIALARDWLHDVLLAHDKSADVVA